MILLHQLLVLLAKLHHGLKVQFFNFLLFFNIKVTTIIRHSGFSFCSHNLLFQFSHLFSQRYRLLIYRVALCFLYLCSCKVVERSIAMTAETTEVQCATYRTGDTPTWTATFTAELIFWLHLCTAVCTYIRM